MRAILVSVEYADLLEITLPYNRHHFDEVMVVTNETDAAAEEIAQVNGARVHQTDAFYRRGAVFNKWLALEEGLDAYGRHGLLCVMDADVLWPEKINPVPVERGQLWAPYRRMLKDFSGEIPPENQWLNYPRHRNVNEWAGYSQIFHADDPCLGPPPWHEVDWSHAGGADSFFQRRWPKAKKFRPDFEVLHLGAAGTNWCGRTTQFLDGTEPEEADTRRRKLGELFATRRRNRNFQHEKLR